jgi:hypothetical protein
VRILDTATLPAGVSADDAIAILRADGRIVDDEIVVVIRREQCDDEPVPTGSLCRPEPAEPAKPAPDATIGATPRVASDVVRELDRARARAGRSADRAKTIDVAAPDYQAAIEFLRGLGAPYYVTFDAGDLHYVVSFRRAGQFDVEIARDSDARVVVDAVRAHRACRVHLQ